MDLSLLMLMRGGNIDRNTLHTLVDRANDKRRKIFMKLADLLFGLIMFFWGDLQINVTNSAGKTVDATDPSVTAEDKMNAMLAAMKSTNKSTLFRELVRPFIISVAEVIATLMEPDEMILNMMAGGGMGQPANGGVFPAPAYVPAGGGGAPAGSVYVAPPAPPAPAVNQVAQQYEGQLIKDPQDPRVFHIVGGQRHWIVSQEAFNRRGYNGNSINRNVPISVIMQIPAGPDEY